MFRGNEISSVLVKCNEERRCTSVIKAPPRLNIHFNRPNRDCRNARMVEPRLSDLRLILCDGPKCAREKQTENRQRFLWHLSLLVLISTEPTNHLHFAGSLAGYITGSQLSGTGTPVVLRCHAARHLACPATVHFPNSRAREPGSARVPLTE